MIDFITTSLYHLFEGILLVSVVVLLLVVMAAVVVFIAHFLD